MNIDKRRFW